MEENNKVDAELFDHVSADANDWQVVNNAEETIRVQAEVAPAAPLPAPQVWDDIPREEPAPATQTENALEITEMQVAPETASAPPLAEPQIWDDIPREDPAPATQTENAPEITEPQVVAQELPPEFPEVAPEVPPVENPVAEEPAKPEIPPVQNIPASPLPETGDEPVSTYRFVAPAEISTLAEMGHYLAQMRQRAQLSSDEVSETTKIRPDYLAAIESGDASELPQAVYVLAYIRKLCELYSIDTGNLNDFFEDLRDGFSYELPEDISKSIVDHENDEEQDKKVRRLAIGLISAAVIVILALVIGVVALIVTLSRSADSSSCTVSDRKIMEYQGKPTLFMQKIPPRR